jgi:hypothetical protein
MVGDFILYQDHCREDVKPVLLDHTSTTTKMNVPHVQWDNTLQMVGIIALIV